MGRDSRDTDNFLYRCRTTLETGFNRLVTPENSSLRLLSYSRLILDSGKDKFTFNSGKEEFFFFIIEGSVNVKFNGQEIELKKFDSIYLSTEENIVFCSREKRVDICVVSAPSDFHCFSRVIRYDEVLKNQKLHYFIGSEKTNDYREQHVYLYSEIPAARLLFGFARGYPGNWCSVPPHKHTDRMEEIYVFFDMEDSPCGVQFVYDDDKNLSHSYLVQNEDAVIVPYGYHPNVAFPGKKLNFIWAMASHKENDRKLIIDVEPEFCSDGRQRIESF